MTNKIKLPPSVYLPKITRKSPGHSCTCCVIVSHTDHKVDLELLWKTIHQDLPELHAQVRLLIEQGDV